MASEENSLIKSFMALLSILIPFTVGGVYFLINSFLETPPVGKQAVIFGIVLFFSLIISLTIGIVSLNLGKKNKAVVVQSWIGIGLTLLIGAALFIPAFIRFSGVLDDMRIKDEERVEIEFGTIEGSVYSNNYFGFSITLPETWDLQGGESLAELQKYGRKMIAGDNKNLDRVLKASELSTVNLFTCFQFPLGTPTDYNSNILAIAEKVSHLPGIKSGDDYLEHAKKLLAQSKMTVTFPKPIYSETLGGKSFDVMSTHMQIGIMSIHQKMYVTILNGYALAFAITYKDSTIQKELEDVLTSITFTEK